jgi:membrane peptidoglycan carboxypeptidase
VFANGGVYAPVGFIRKIETNDGTLLYERKEETDRVFSEETTTLLNDMLETAAKSGTAKRMKNLPYTVCAKTGTCGSLTGNTDAYCLAYTSRDVIGVWLGYADNRETEISGGGLPANLNTEIQKYLYETETPPPLARSNKVKEYLLDKIEYEENHRLLLCDDNAPLTQKTLKEVFKESNAPAEKSDYFSRPRLARCAISATNGAVTLALCQAEYLSIIVNRQGNDGFITVYQGKAVSSLCDDSVITGEKYTYSVTPYYEKFVGETVILPTVFVGSQ